MLFLLQLTLVLCVVSSSIDTGVVCCLVLCVVSLQLTLVLCVVSSSINTGVVCCFFFN